MDSVGQIISGLIGVGIVLMIAPRVLAANKGKILQNIAIWIGIFLILALIYQTYGPGKLEQPQTVDDQPRAPTQIQPARTADDPDDKGDKVDTTTDPDSQTDLNENQGFTPPREE